MFGTQTWVDKSGNENSLKYHMISLAELYDRFTELQHSEEMYAHLRDRMTIYIKEIHKFNPKMAMLLEITETLYVNKNRRRDFITLIIFGV